MERLAEMKTTKLNVNKGERSRKASDVKLLIHVISDLG